jgi:hypothetical protein
MNRNVIRVLLAVMIPATVSWPLAAAEDTSAAPAEQLGAWDTLPLPAAAKEVNINVEPGGILWLATPAGPFYWAGSEFRPAVNQSEAGRLSMGGLIGGGDRDLYISAAGGELQRKLFRLRDGRLEYITTCYADPAYEGSRLHVAKSGKLINWGQRFLEVYTGGQWTRIEARLEPRATVVCDGPEAVYIYCDGRGYVVDAQDNISEVKVTLPDAMSTTQQPVSGVAWGDHGALLYRRHEKGLVAVDLRTGAPVTPDSLKVAFAARPVVWALPALNGAVWVATRPERAPGVDLTLVTSEGQVEAHPALAKLHWRWELDSRGPHTLLGAADGTYWFALKTYDKQPNQSDLSNTAKVEVK